MLLQPGGLHMTGRIMLGNVKHATRLFLVLLPLRMRFGWLAGPEGGLPSRPGTGG